jgi:hypothetical protein
MVTFRYERTACRCVDQAVNRSIVWLDPGAPGRVYVYQSSEDAVGAAG